MKLICFSLILSSIFAFGNFLDIDRFRTEALTQHNLYRSQCHVEPLKSNLTLDQQAQVWCNELLTKNKFEHSGQTQLGENSYRKIPFDFQKDNGTTPVTHWFSKSQFYNRTNLSQSLEYTQLVWKSTSQLGIGVCSGENNLVIFVALYYPRGNYQDQFDVNVLC